MSSLTSIVDPLAYVGSHTSGTVLSSSSTSSLNLCLVSEMRFDGHYDSDCYLLVEEALGNDGNTGAKARRCNVTTAEEQGNMLLGRCTEPRERWTSRYFKDKALLMKLKRKGDVLDAESMMLSLSWPTCPSTSASIIPSMWYTPMTIKSLNNVDYQLCQELHQEEHLDSDDETEMMNEQYDPVSSGSLTTDAQNVQ
ncbi:hypothetical protein Tco_0134494 [Tanacetum coccineum]